MRSRMTIRSITAAALLVLGIIAAPFLDATAAPGPPAIVAKDGTNADRGVPPQIAPPQVSGPQVSGPQVSGPQTSPPVPRSQQLPLGVSILAVMAGSINRSSTDIFRAATSVKDLSQGDWLQVSEAAVDLIGAATLITTPGTGPNDGAWVADPRWLKLSTEMQAAGVVASIAARNKDRAALTDATARLAQSCQSCHMSFSPRLVTSPSAPSTAPR